MSETIFAIKATAFAQKNDFLRNALGRDERMFLLKREGQTKRLESVVEVAVGWQVKFDGFRGQMGFRIATTDDGFADDIAQATHIGYGVPSGGQIEVFSIDPDRRDVVAPNGSSVYWKVFATKEPQERYTIV